MRIRRDVSSIPFCSAAETWQKIIDLVTGYGSVDLRQLRDAGGVMGSIITDEHPAERAIVIEGVGPQVRLYCRYGMSAVEEGAAVDSLTWNPTAGDWKMRVPCDAENIGWVKSSLSVSSPRIRVFDVAEGDWANEEETKDVEKSNGIIVDWNFRG
jgi:hypothetical protein